MAVIYTGADYKSVTGSVVGAPTSVYQWSAGEFLTTAAYHYQATAGKVVGVTVLRGFHQCMTRKYRVLTSVKKWLKK